MFFKKINDSSKSSILIDQNCTNNREQLQKAVNQLIELDNSITSVTIEIQVYSPGYGALVRKNPYVMEPIKEMFAKAHQESCMLKHVTINDIIMTPGDLMELCEQLPQKTSIKEITLEHIVFNNRYAEEKFDTL